MKPFDMTLTKDERAILDSVERGEWKSVRNLAKEKSRFETTARATLRKDKRVNIRMTERDMLRFQKKAAEEGLPYQTLISSVLHKYINRGKPD
jgi:predicted DNA binding CopG/RHH family protein